MITIYGCSTRRGADRTAHDIVIARHGAPVMGLLARTPPGRVRYPVTLACKMSALANTPDALKVMLRDKTSTGNAMWLRFLGDY